MIKRSLLRKAPFLNQLLSSHWRDRDQTDFQHIEDRIQFDKRLRGVDHIVGDHWSGFLL